MRVQQCIVERKVRSTALSKAISSIPTCGYVDRRDKLIIMLRGGRNDLEKKRELTIQNVSLSVHSTIISSGVKLEGTSSPD